MYTHASLSSLKPHIVLGTKSTVVKAGIRERDQEKSQDWGGEDGRSKRKTGGDESCPEAHGQENVANSGTSLEYDVKIAQPWTSK